MSAAGTGSTGSTGPLRDVRVLELAGFGPAPFCGMLLSDMGADVVRIDRPDAADYGPADIESRGRRSIVADLKTDPGRALALALTEKADVLIEGFRPGVMERLGLGPDTALAANPALVYGRMTGWGQSGPMAKQAGHDINFLSLSGALHALGTREKPAVPLNVIADFGGGALYLAMGVLAALHHARRTGEGQVVDCAMTDGVVSMLAMIYGDLAAGTWTDARESNVIDGAAPFYNVYRCADGGWLSVGAIESPFFERLLAVLGIEAAQFGNQWDRALWSEQSRKLAALFATRSRGEWVDAFAGVDACVTPVLSLAEARAHAQNAERQVFETVDGVAQPAPSPRFLRTPSRVAFGPRGKDAHREEILDGWGVREDVRLRPGGSGGMGL